MSRSEGEKGTRADSTQHAANDQVAQQQGGQANAAAVKACTLWTLRAEVTAMVGPRKPKLDDATVEIGWSDGTLDARGCTLAGNDKGTMTSPVIGKGHYTGECRAASKGWYLEAPKQVTLDDGDDKTVALVLKPALWVAFNVIDHKTNDPVEQIQVKAKLGQAGDVDGTTVKDAPLEIEHDGLRPGATCKLLGLGHDAMVWEVVGDIASA